MAERTFRLGPHLGRRCLGLAVVEVLVAPSACVGVSLGVLAGDVAAVELAWEVTPAGRLRRRAVGELLWFEDALQFLEEDRALRKLAGLLVDVVGSRLDVDVVIFGKACLAVVQGVGR